MHPSLVVLALSAGGLFTALPSAAKSGPLVGTLVPIALAVTFAIAAAGRPSTAATMAGAVAAFAGSIAWTMFPVLGGAVLLGVAYAERSARVRPVRARVVHVGLAVLAGGAAGALTSAYASAPLPHRAVAIVMGSVLATLPLFVPADDPRVHLLEAAARRLGAPLAATLLEGVELLRCGDTSLLDRETASTVRKSWRSLDRLIEARLAMLGGAPTASKKSETATMVTAMVDRQITEHVATLTRAYAAVTTAGAAEIGLDDSAVREVHARGEALDEQSRAIVEVGPR
jgi:hypothetical protein